MATASDCRALNDAFHAAFNSLPSREMSKVFPSEPFAVSGEEIVLVAHPQELIDAFRTVDRRWVRLAILGKGVTA